MKRLLLMVGACLALACSPATEAPPPVVTEDPLVLQFPQALAQLNALDGFSTVGGVIASFSGPLDVRGIALDPTADPPDPTPLRDASGSKTGRL